MRYEYIRLSFDWNDLAELNRLGSEGWRVVAVSGNVRASEMASVWVPTVNALLERRI